MASLSKNGTEIGRIETTVRKYSFRSNGKILVNFSGGGWKLAGNGKKHDDIERVYREEKAKQDAQPETLKAWVQCFQDTFGFSDRSLAKAAFDLLCDDADGLCVELQDAGIAVTLDEIVDLCQLWEVYLADRECSPTVVYKVDHVGKTILEICVNRTIAKVRCRWHVDNERALGSGAKVRFARATLHEVEAYLALGNLIRN